MPRIRFFLILYLNRPTISELMTEGTTSRTVSPQDRSDESTPLVDWSRVTDSRRCSCSILPRRYFSETRCARGARSRGRTCVHRVLEKDFSSFRWPTDTELSPTCVRAGERASKRVSEWILWLQALVWLLRKADRSGRADECIPAFNLRTILSRCILTSLWTSEMKRMSAVLRSWAHRGSLRDRRRNKLRLCERRRGSLLLSDRGEPRLTFVNYHFVSGLGLRTREGRVLLMNEPITKTWRTVKLRKRACKQLIISRV